jgi:hypothetical protein
MASCFYKGLIWTPDMHSPFISLVACYRRMTSKKSRLVPTQMIRMCLSETIIVRCYITLTRTES